MLFQNIEIKIEHTSDIEYNIYILLLWYNIFLLIPPISFKFLH